MRLSTARHVVSEPIARVVQRQICELLPVDPHVPAVVLDAASDWHGSVLICVVRSRGKRPALFYSVPMAAANLLRRRLIECAVGAIVLVAVSSAAAVLAPAAVAKSDQTPPVFAGLTSATTCVPGPISPGQSVSYTLIWDPASDNTTPPKKIGYEIYQTSKPGGEDYTAATYVTDAGAARFTTPALPVDQSVYFVVRARDRVGNRDANQVERQGVNICV